MREGERVRERESKRELGGGGIDSDIESEQLFRKGPGSYSPSPDSSRSSKHIV
jgi:hypothetical protein